MITTTVINQSRATTPCYSLNLNHRDRTTRSSIKASFLLRRRRCPIFNNTSSSAATATSTTTTTTSRPRMNQKKVLITGSTKGLGFEIAKQFLEQGDRVCVTSRNEANVKFTVSQFKKMYGNDNVCGVACDVSSAKDIEKLAKHCVDSLGGVDFWINNAGTNGYEYNDIVDQDPETIEEVVRTNSLGTLLCCREAIRTMREQEKTDVGYHVFNMEGAGSDGAETRKYAAYGFTKAGLTQLTKTLNKELQTNEKLKDKMIKVHTVSPGMVFTDLISSGRYSFGKQGRMFVNALAEPANVAASGLVEKIKVEIAKSEGKKSLAIKLLTPDVAVVKLFNRFVKQVNKDRYYPENDEDCENIMTECIVGEVQSVNLLAGAQSKVDDDVVSQLVVAKEEVQENLSR